MIIYRNHNQIVKTVFVDVDTQLDFLFPAGALYVPGAEQICKALSRLTQLANARQIQILSTADAHTEDDPEFKTWPPHCVIGTTGQIKCRATLLNDLLILPTSAGAFDPIRTRISTAKQIIVEKQTLDVFSNPNLASLLETLRADRFVVYGVVTEYCVGAAALGLLKTGAQVELVTDAIKSLNSSDEQKMIDRVQSQGGRLTTVAAVQPNLE